MKQVVGDTGIEPVTPSMSTKCSTAELITHLSTQHSAPNKMGREGRAGSAAIKGVAGGIKSFWLLVNLVYSAAKG